MDPIHSISPQKDTSLALMLEAQARGWEIYYLTQDKLFLENYIILGSCRRLQVINNPQHYYEFIDTHEIPFPLHDFDVVFMRKDPPVNKRFLYTTYFLDIAKKNGAFIINDPNAIRDSNEKLLATHFPQCCPELIVTSNQDQIIAFLNRHQSIIIKPLSHMGGHGVLKLSQHDPNIFASIELLTHNGKLPIMVQRFIPEIAQGDKRIIMIDGEAFSYALARIPQPGDIRGNLSAHAKGIVQPLSERDNWIAHQVGPMLKEKGLFLVGLDIIGDYLTEINVTSPTGVREIDAAIGATLCPLIWNTLENKIKKR